ncbi:hypothetical protein BD413DRAFT_270593 [Trametes elegans]|nr:hypothetical protein BD413DRAFT_270593 [Trametes elegans]
MSTIQSRLQVPGTVLRGFGFRASRECYHFSGVCGDSVFACRNLLQSELEGASTAVYPTLEEPGAPSS